MKEYGYKNILNTSNKNSSVELYPINKFSVKYLNN